MRRADGRWTVYLHGCSGRRFRGFSCQPPARGFQPHGRGRDRGPVRERSVKLLPLHQRSLRPPAAGPGPRRGHHPPHHRRAVGPVPGARARGVDRARRSATHLPHSRSGFVTASQRRARFSAPMARREADHRLGIDLLAGLVEELAQVHPAAVAVAELVGQTADVGHRAAGQEDRECRFHVRVALARLYEGVAKIGRLADAGFLAVAALAGVEEKHSPACQRWSGSSRSSTPAAVRPRRRWVGPGFPALRDEARRRPRRDCPRR